MDTDPNTDLNTDLTDTNTDFNTDLIDPNTDIDILTSVSVISV